MPLPNEGESMDVVVDRFPDLKVQVVARFEVVKKDAQRSFYVLRQTDMRREVLREEGESMVLSRIFVAKDFRKDRNPDMSTAIVIASDKVQAKVVLERMLRDKHGITCDDSYSIEEVPFQEGFAQLINRGLIIAQDVYEMRLYDTDDLPI